MDLAVRADQLELLLAKRAAATGDHDIGARPSLPACFACTSSMHSSRRRQPTSGGAQPFSRWVVPPAEAGGQAEGCYSGCADTRLSQRSAVQGAAPGLCCEPGDALHLRSDEPKAEGTEKPQECSKMWARMRRRAAVAHGGAGGGAAAAAARLAGAVHRAPPLCVHARHRGRPARARAGAHAFAPTATLSHATPLLNDFRI